MKRRPIDFSNPLSHRETPARGDIVSNDCTFDIGGKKYKLKRAEEAKAAESEKKNGGSAPKDEKQPTEPKGD